MAVKPCFVSPMTWKDRVLLENRKKTIPEIALSGNG